TVALGFLDLGPAEPGVLVGLEREEARQRLLDGEAGVVLELAPLGGGRPVDDFGQREHAEAHVPGLVLEDSTAHRLEDRIARALGHHLEQRHGERLSHELQPDRLQVPPAVTQDRVEDVARIGGGRVLPSAWTIGSTRSPPTRATSSTRYWVTAGGT